MNPKFTIYHLPITNIGSRISQLPTIAQAHAHYQLPITNIGPHISQLPNLVPSQANKEASKMISLKFKVKSPKSEVKNKKWLGGIGEVFRGIGIPRVIGNKGWVCALIVLIFMASVAYAVGISQKINYQGRLIGQTGDKQIKFNIASSSGSWEDTYTITLDSNGVFSKSLGPITSTVFDAADAKLTVTDVTAGEPGTVLVSAQDITAVGYAFKALKADEAATVSGTLDYLPLAGGTLTGDLTMDTGKGISLGGVLKTAWPTLSDIGAVSSADLATHATSTATHGATGAIVGTTNTQTLTSKTLTSPVINTATISGGTIGGVANINTAETAANTIGTAGKTTFKGSGANLTGVLSASDLATHATATATHGATGAIVGTTNTQTLTSKTLTSPVINTATISGGTIGGVANINTAETVANTIGTAGKTMFYGIGTNLTSVTGTDSTKVLKAGDTMTGTLNFSGVTSDITGAVNEHISIMPQGTGKVGIGTASPGAKLEVKAGAEGQLSPVEAIRIWGPNSPADSNSAQDLKWDFVAAGSAGIRAYRGGSWDTYLQFLTNAAGQGSDSPQVRMHISESGNVGIGGAPAPGAKLDVMGGAIRTNNQLISTVAAGTAPLSVTSNTVVSNLNADLLDGSHSTSFLTTATDYGRSGVAASLYEGTTALSAKYAPLAGGGNYVQLQSTTPGTQQTGNLNISGTGIFSGKVGIGTGAAAPNAALQVNGAISRQGTTLYGTEAGTHVNLGVDSTTGRLGSDNIMYASVLGGSGNTASGWYSTAMGHLTIASGLRSTAMGYNTTASGQYSTAMGSDTIASYDYSTAMGRDTTASYNYSTAMGYKTTASYNYSTAMGNSTTASGASSTAMGNSTTASGAISTAMGSDTIAQASTSFVIGRYNVISGSAVSWVDTDPLFVIGNGTGDSTRSNAVTVLKNGHVGIGTTDPGTHRLRVIGSALFTEHNDGDVAERFATQGAPPEAGDVVVVAGEKGVLEKCAMEYDTRAAGIISTSPTILVGQDKDGQPLALSGRVPCNVDASYGAIKVGDLLTTSATPGYAMVVKDKARALGAIIGKALESWSEGKRKIDVLVSLQ